MIGTALQEMVTAPLLPPEEGRVVNPLFPFLSVLPLAQQPAVPKFSIKEQFLSSPGPKRPRRVVGGAKPLHSHPPLLSPADSSAQFEMGTQASPAPPVRPWNQVSVAQHTQTPLRAASQREPPELRPCVPPRCPTVGTPVVPLVPLVRSLRAWLALPSPSRWLIRTIRLGLCEHRDLVLSNLSQLGLQVNWEKSKLAPVQRISFLGMELDSVEQSARLTEERAQSVLNCLNTFRGRTAVPLKLFQRLLGHMAAAVADRFSTGFKAESRDGRGNAACTEWQSLRNAAEPSARGQTPCFSGQECP